MRETFLELFGLPHGASEEDIKKRYRELALKLHPDVNPAPNAQEQFRLIQKAYEFLINEDKQLNLMYQQYKSTKGGNKQKAPAEDELSIEEKRAQARERAKYYAQQAHKEAEEIELQVFETLTQKVPWAIVRFLAGASVVFGLLILVDFFVPDYNHSRVLKHKIHKEIFQTSTFIFTNGDKIKVEEALYLGTNAGDTITMQYSNILREFLGYRVSSPRGESRFVSADFSLFTFYPMFGLMFLLPGILFVYQANEVKFYLLYFASCVAFPGLILHYVLSEDKLLHVFNFFFG